jgi:hypothetical protein
MTSGNGLVFLFGAVAVVWLVVATQRIDTLEGDKRQLTKELQAQTQARNTAEWLLHGQQQTMQVFSAIRAANRAARADDEIQLNDAKNTITAAVGQDDCSTRAVPAAAADQLRQLEDYARAAGSLTAPD